MRPKFEANILIVYNKLIMSATNEEGPFESRPDLNDEAVRAQLVQDCIAESFALLSGKRLFVEDSSDVAYLDGQTQALAEAASDPVIAREIADPESQLAVLATISHQTSNQELERQVISEAVSLFDDEDIRKYRVLVKVASALGSTQPLEYIEGPETRDQATYEVACKTRSLEIARKITGSELRSKALFELLIHGTGDFTPIIDAMDTELERQHAIRHKAWMGKDFTLASQVTDVASRLRTYLNIKAGDNRLRLPDDVPELLMLVPDDDPVSKAELYQQFVGYDELGGLVGEFSRVVALIDQPRLRFYYETIIVGITEDRLRATELEKELPSYAARFQRSDLDEIYVGLARALQSSLYADMVSAGEMRKETQAFVAIKIRAVPEAWDYGNVHLLDGIVDAFDDTELAASVANDIRYRQTDVGNHARAALLAVAIKLGSMDPILRIDDVSAREKLQVQYLVARDDLDVIDLVESPTVRDRAKLQLAREHQDLVLAHQLVAEGVDGAKELAARIEHGLMQLAADQLELPEIALLDDPESRIARYYPYLRSGNLSVQNLIAADILQAAPAGERFTDFMRLAITAQNPLYAYEALNDLKGRIALPKQLRFVCMALRLIRDPQTKLDTENF